MKQCPYCAEDIQDEALKCRHCKSELRHKSGSNKLKASDHESYKTFTLVALLFPLIGFILGVVYLTKNSSLDKKLGEHALTISVLFGILWSVAWVAFGSSAFII